jgi:hypothetical protein
VGTIHWKCRCTKQDKDRVEESEICNHTELLSVKGEESEENRKSVAKYRLRKRNSQVHTNQILKIRHKPDIFLYCVQWYRKHTLGTENCPGNTENDRKTVQVSDIAAEPKKGRTAEKFVTVVIVGTRSQGVRRAFLFPPRWTKLNQPFLIIF